MLQRRPSEAKTAPATDDLYTYRLDEDLSGPESPPWSDAVPMQLPREASKPAPVTDFGWLEPDLPYFDDAAGRAAPPPAQPRGQSYGQDHGQDHGQGYARDAHGYEQGSGRSSQGSPARQPRHATPAYGEAYDDDIADDLTQPATREPQPAARDRAEAKTAPKTAAKPATKSSRKSAAKLDGFDGVLMVDAVEKSYRGRKVVRGVSLYVREGEAVGLLGPNGAGKTTVFYMTTGLVKADTGRIFLHGYDITAMPMYRRARLGIGYLPQEPSIFRGLNVEDNIRAVLEVVEPNRKKREEELDALLDEFGIARLRKSPSIALSGGERRRCEIARALATRPSFMLLDEPFAGIDPIAVGDIQALVRHLTHRGIGVLITDHNVRETLGLIDRAYIIHSGEVLMEGSADDIVSSPDVRRLYLGEEFRL
ncbi:Lipopolysaccharide export system ATP-binding protein LptB [Blastochloris viridis]|uniref:Lipopolysaccharide export system ATP-binding protein LptB n=1 Tax=Blastochloris viridis TaxID=1079 RepID=A0A0S4Q9G3_BLAVI|nr:Lipopolysaccharide export system ATP-binding protein LptB [Blastochloris viridis]